MATSPGDYDQVPLAGRGRRSATTTSAMSSRGSDRLRSSTARDMRSASSSALRPRGRSCLSRSPVISSAASATGLENVLLRPLLTVRMPKTVHGPAFAADNAGRNTAELGAVAAGGVQPDGGGTRTTTSRCHDGRRHCLRHLPRLSLRTTRERAVRASADDGTAGESGANRARGRPSLDRPKRRGAEPSPTGRRSVDARAMSGRRPADAGRHANGAARYRRPPEAPWSSSTTSWRPVEPGATT